MYTNSRKHPLAESVASSSSSLHSQKRRRIAPSTPVPDKYLYRVPSQSSIRRYSFVDGDGDGNGGNGGNASRPGTSDMTWAGSSVGSIGVPQKEGVSHGTGVDNNNAPAKESIIPKSPFARMLSQKPDFSGPYSGRASFRLSRRPYTKTNVNPFTSRHAGMSPPLFVSGIGSVSPQARPSSSASQHLLASAFTATTPPRNLIRSHSSLGYSPTPEDLKGKSDGILSFIGSALSKAKTALTENRELKSEERRMRMKEEARIRLAEEERRRRDEYFSAIDQDRKHEEIWTSPRTTVLNTTTQTFASGAPSVLERPRAYVDITQRNLATEAQHHLSGRYPSVETIETVDPTVQDLIILNGSIPNARSNNGFSSYTGMFPSGQYQLGSVTNRTIEKSNVVVFSDSEDEQEMLSPSIEQLPAMEEIQSEDICSEDEGEAEKGSDIEYEESEEEYAENDYQEEEYETMENIANSEEQQADEEEQNYEVGDECELSDEVAGSLNSPSIEVIDLEDEDETCEVQELSKNVDSSEEEVDPEPVVYTREPSGAAQKEEIISECKELTKDEESTTGQTGGREQSRYTESQFVVEVSEDEDQEASGNLRGSTPSGSIEEGSTEAVPHECEPPSESNYTHANQNARRIEEVLAVDEVIELSLRNLENEQARGGNEEFIEEEEQSGLDFTTNVNGISEDGRSAIAEEEQSVEDGQPTVAVRAADYFHFHNASTKPVSKHTHQRITPQTNKHSVDIVAEVMGIPVDPELLKDTVPIPEASFGKAELTNAHAKAYGESPNLEGNPSISVGGNEESVLQGTASQRSVVEMSKTSGHNGALQVADSISSRLEAGNPKSASDYKGEATHGKNAKHNHDENNFEIEETKIVQKASAFASTCGLEEGATVSGSRTATTKPNSGAFQIVIDKSVQFVPTSSSAKVDEDITPVTLSPSQKDDTKLSDTLQEESFSILVQNNLLSRDLEIHRDSSVGVPFSESANTAIILGEEYSTLDGPGFKKAESISPCHHEDRSSGCHPESPKASQLGKRRSPRKRKTSKAKARESESLSTPKKKRRVTPITDDPTRRDDDLVSAGIPSGDEYLQVADVDELEEQLLPEGDADNKEEKRQEQLVKRISSAVLSHALFLEHDHEQEGIELRDGKIVPHPVAGSVAPSEVGDRDRVSASPIRVIDGKLRGSPVPIGVATGKELRDGKVLASILTRQTPSPTPPIATSPITGQCFTPRRKRSNSITSSVSGSFEVSTPTSPEVKSLRNRDILVSQPASATDGLKDHLGEGESQMTSGMQTRTSIHAKVRGTKKRNVTHTL